MVDPFTLTMDSVREPRDFASLMAARVSMVSPDWEITITSVLLSIRGSSYRNSEAMDTVTGILSSGSISAFATIPACMAVPQAMMRIWPQSVNNSSGIPSDVKSGSPPARRGRMVFFNASGCSWISFSIKWGNPFFMAASIFQFTSSISGCILAQSISYTRIL